jgi:hypothetical protein
MVKKLKEPIILTDEIKPLNIDPKRINKVTPYGDSTWYVKWISVFLIICAVMCRSVEEVPKFYDVFFSTFGTAGWFWVGYKWHDRALMILNAILLVLLLSSLFRYSITFSW